MKSSFPVCLPLILLVLSSCAHVISEQYREEAVKGVAFRQLLENPGEYVGGTFIFGGTIVETKNTSEGSEIEVIENPIDQYGEIIDSDVSDGRFLVFTPKRLDPGIYQHNRKITMAGKLVGTRQLKLDDTEYAYPLFDAVQIYLWKVRYYAPYPYYYDPFFYPYPAYGPFYGPFWGRPYYYP